MKRKNQKKNAAKTIDAIYAVDAQDVLCYFNPNTCKETAREKPAVLDAFYFLVDVKLDSLEDHEILYRKCREVDSVTTDGRNFVDICCPYGGDFVVNCISPYFICEITSGVQYDPTSGIQKFKGVKKNAKYRVFFDADAVGSYSEKGKVEKGCITYGLNYQCNSKPFGVIS